MHVTIGRVVHIRVAFKDNRVFEAPMVKLQIGSLPYKLWASDQNLTALCLITYGDKYME